MADKNTAASILAGLTQGLRQGLELREKRQQEQQALRVKQRELEVRAEQEKNRSEFNSLVKQKMLGIEERKLGAKEVSVETQQKRDLRKQFNDLVTTRSKLQETEDGLKRQQDLFRNDPQKLGEIQDSLMAVREQKDQIDQQRSMIITELNSFNSKAPAAIQISPEGNEVRLSPSQEDLKSRIEVADTREQIMALNQQLVNSGIRKGTEIGRVFGRLMAAKIKEIDRLNVQRAEQQQLQGPLDALPGQAPADIGSLGIPK